MDGGVWRSGASRAWRWRVRPASGTRSCGAGGIGRSVGPADHAQPTALTLLMTPPIGGRAPRSRQASSPGLVTVKREPRHAAMTARRGAAASPRVPTIVAKNSTGFRARSRSGRGAGFRAGGVCGRGGRGLREAGLAASLISLWTREGYKIQSLIWMLSIAKPV
jgi:hypothetical protein